MIQILRWTLGGALVLAASLPLQRLLDPSLTGPAGRGTRSVLDGLLPSVWGQTLGVVILAGLIAWIGAGDRLLGWVQTTADLLRPIPERAWAAACGVLATAGSGVVMAWLLHRRATLIDEMAQLRHARLMAEGRLAEAWPFDPAFRSIQNGLFSGEGWVSIYPPGHTALLAAGIRSGLHPWTGPLMAGVAALLTVLILVRLWPDRPATVRIAGLAVAVSPFLWGLGAGYLSHMGTLAGVGATIWATLRARDGSSGWALAAGAMAGWTVTARPWTGIALALVLPAGLLISTWRREGKAPSWLGTRIGLAAVGGLPFAVWLGATNARLFGDPTTFGYSAAFGPSHGLGLHPDPWGNVYGLQEAVGYSGADLAQLGVRLLETPISLVLVVGVWLLLIRHLPKGTGLLLGWALLPVLANAVYWHHGIHRGPRMLLESAPAWIALAVLALAQGSTLPAARRTRGAVAALAVLSFGWAMAVGIPPRVASWSLPPEELLPTPPTSPAIVFVHGSWASREVARMAAQGVRRDSIETATRRNDLCDVHLAVGALEAGSGLGALDLNPLPGSPPGLSRVLLSPGNAALLRDPNRLDASCVRQARADASGVTPLAPILARVSPWSPDVPVVWVRDLGPAANRALVEALPGRSAWVWGTEAGLEGFDAGMARIWGAVSPAEISDADTDGP